MEHLTGRTLTTPEATLPAAAGIVSGTPCPNVGKHPFTG